MNTENELYRFVEAQQHTYAVALSEIRGGRKQSHWMWFIFPQIQGLGLSETSRYYGIKDRAEAEAFLQHPVLGSRLIEISHALLALETSSAKNVFGSPDDLKLQSSMTLFAALPQANAVFQAVLDKFFMGTKDTKTLQLLDKQQ